nr:hypothetical protein 5 [bacterium]
MKKITNEDLTIQDIPTPESSFEEISKFALTFDGYEYWGSLKKCADEARRIGRVYAEKKELPNDISTLRAVLFWEQRSIRNACCGGLSRDEENALIEDSLSYMRAIVEKIRLLKKENQ